jgi:hypothetical protein
MKHGWGPAGEIPPVNGCFVVGKSSIDIYNIRGDSHNYRNNHYK